MADHGEVPIARSASAQPQDFVNLVGILARFQTEGLAWVRLDLSKPTHHLSEVVCDHHNLAVGDANELLGIGRLWIAPRLFIDSSGKLPIEMLDRV